MELANTIKYIAKQQGITEVDFMSDVLLFDEGNGPFIKEWNLEIDKPTAPELATAEVAMLAEMEATAYKAERAAAYPSIQDQLDMQYWDLVNGTTTWKDTIDGIKSEYPKPE